MCLYLLYQQYELAGYTNLTIMNMKAQFETVQCRMARYASCVGQERRVVCALSGVVVCVGMITLVLCVVVTMGDSSTYPDELESAYSKGKAT